MKTLILLLAVVCVISTGSCQWLEKTLYLPDSLSGVIRPSCAVYNPVGNKLYVTGMGDPRFYRGGVDCWVVVIDGTTNQRVARFPVRSEVSAITYNQTNNKVYVANEYDRSITIADAGTDTVIANIPVSYWAGPGMCWNPVANKVYCGLGSDSGVVVIDGTTDSILSTIRDIQRSDRIGCIPEFNRVYCWAYDEDPAEVTMIDCTADTVVARIPFPDFPYDACYDTVRHRLYFAASDYLVEIDPAGDTISRVTDVSEYGLVSLCFNPSRGKLYLAEEVDSLVVVDAYTFSVLASLPVGQYLGSVRYNSRDDKVYCSDSSGFVVHVIDCATDQVMAVLTPGTLPTDLAVNPQNGRVYCLNTGSDDVTVIDGAGDTVITTVAVGGRPVDVCYNPARNKVYINSVSTGLVSVIDGATNNVVANVRVGYGCYHICYNPVADKVYCAIRPAAKVAVIDCATDSVVANVSVDSLPHYIICDSLQNKVYTANYRYWRPSVSAINCATDTAVATIVVDEKPSALGYNSLHDKLYVGANAAEVLVVDCARDSIAGDVPNSVAGYIIMYNPAFDKAYFADGENVFVVDGTADSVCAQVVAPGQGSLTGMCINATRNKVYLAFNEVFASHADLIILDALTDRVLGDLQPDALRNVLYNSVNDKVYLAQDGDTGLVTVLDSKSDSVVGQFSAGLRPNRMVSNPRQNRVYVLNEYSSSVSVLRDSGGAGVEQSPRQQIADVEPAATMVRGVLTLPEASSAEPQATCLLDISGRKVADLHPGANDVRHLVPGVYFYRLDTPGFTDVKKAVLVR